MAFTINSNYLVYAPDAIDTRMLVDRVDGTTSSLVSLDTTFNYRNMYVWVREEKSFYYLIDSPEEGGATVSDWTQASGGVGGSASAIDLTEVAFGTGTGITSSNNFTFDNTCNNLISSKGSKFCQTLDGLSITSPNSAIIGGTGNSIFQAALGSTIGSNLILGSENSTVATFSNIVGSDNLLSIISGRENIIGYSSYRSTLIAGCKNIGDGMGNSAIIGGIGNCINGSVAVSIIGSSGSFIDLSKRSVILGGIGLTLSNEDSVVYVPELKIATASNSSTTDKVLVWDTTDNYVKWRSDSSLGLAKDAKKVAWENDLSYPTMPGQTQSWGLTAGLDPNTVIFYNGNNSFDSPQGDIVVSLNPATATLGLNRDFKLILGNGGRVETGNTWSVAYNGTRLVEYTEGRIEPHVLDFSWATSSEVPNGEYLLTKYMLESPVNDSITTGAAYGGDFTSVKRMMGYFGSLYTTFGTPGSPSGRGGSTVFPKGSILFVNESFVTCEGITGSTTGITVSFGLTEPTSLGSYGALINQWQPSLASFGVPHSGKIIFPDKALGDFATGSVYYSNSPVGIIRLTEPAMIVITVEGGAIATFSYLKCTVPYIVDEASVNSISGTNFIAAPPSTGCAKSGYVSGTSFTGNPALSSVVFSTPYSSASYSVALTSHAFTIDDYEYSVINKTANGFTIRVDNPSPIGATAMWITNCYDGSGLSSGGPAGPQGPAGSGNVPIDLKEVAFGTGTGITSSNNFTFDLSNDNLIVSSFSTITSEIVSSIIAGGQYNTICCYSSNSSIIGGKNNTTDCSIYTSIIGGRCSSIFQSSWSAIIGGSSATMSCSPGSVIAGGIGFWGTDEPVTTIIIAGTSGGNLIYCGQNNFLTGGFYSKTQIGASIYTICNFPNRIYNSISSNIIGGVLNKVCNSIASSIIGGANNELCNSCFSSIIGGSNTLCNNSCNSAIIGGVGLTLSNECSVVYVPKLKIATASNNDSVSKVLVWDTADNYVKWRSSSTLGGGSGSGIDITEIAFGTGTGITSSNIFTFDNSDLNLLASTASSFSNSKESIILGGNSNLISNSCYSGIIGGTGLSIIGALSENSMLIGGSNNYFCGQNMHNSSIVGGFKNKIQGTNCNNAIIGGSKNSIGAESYNSLVLGGYCNLMKGGPANSRHSAIIGGRNNTICESCLCGSSIIVGGHSNLLNETNNTTIINSCISCQCCSSFSSIISGVSQSIIKSKNSSIIGGCNNTVAGTSSLSSIIGASGSKIYYSNQSSIISGYQNTMTASSNSIILGGNNLQMNSIDNMVYVPSVRGFGSVQFDLATSSSNYTLTQDNFTLLAYPTITGMTVSLPTAISSPHRLYVIKKDGSSTQSIVYIDPNVSDTIEGYAGSIELINPWDYNILQSDGVNMWIKLGGAVGINL